jgi:hypothetical protein
MTTSDYDDELDELDALERAYPPVGADPDELLTQLAEVTAEIRTLRSRLEKALRERDLVRKLLWLAPVPHER